MACRSCGQGGNKATAAAFKELESRYSTTRPVKNGVCPLDGTRAGVTWFRFKGVKIAYRRCANDHTLRV
jgi:hypothetical protein